MTATTLFYIIIGILSINFLVDLILDHLNASRYNAAVPEELANLYNPEEYQKSQDYKKVRFNFGLVSGSIMFLATLAFIFLDGFAFVSTSTYASSTQVTSGI